jgi:hypothetical protein
MQYILLIYGDEKVGMAMSEADIKKEMDDYNAFTAFVQQKGALVAGEALHPTNAATTVKVRNGKTLTTDGPFAETHEQLGGYYVVNAKDLDEAVEIAAKIPGASKGCVEVRPIVVFG